MSDYWLSVLIPTYNGEKYLRQTLDSVLEEDLRDVEFVVVDDGSTDSTRIILDSYSSRLNLKIFDQPHSGNWITGVNRALQLSSGKYISILHQDDCWIKGRLEVMRRLAVDHPDVALFFHPVWIMGPSGKRLGKWNCPFSKKTTPLDSDSFFSKLLIQNFISIPAPFFRRDSALKIGGFDPNLLYSGDWDFWLKMARSGKIFYCPELLAIFRVHPGSQTVSISASLKGFQDQLKTVLERHSVFLGSSKTEQKAKETAWFSVKANSAFAALLHKRAVDFPDLFYSFLRLGWGGMMMYLQCARFFDRVVPRIRMIFG